MRRKFGMIASSLRNRILQCLVIALMVFPMGPNFATPISIPAADVGSDPDDAGGTPGGTIPTDPYARQVQQMYIAYYGRPGDPGGVDYWSGRLSGAGGNWIADLVNAFGTSNEYRDRFGGLSDETLIDNLYRQLFNRGPDPAGLGFYVDLLNGGNVSGYNPDLRQSTLAQIALDIANGALNLDVRILQNKLDVAAYFTAQIVETGRRYQNADIAEVVTIFNDVTPTSSSVMQGKAAVDVFIAAGGQPKTGIFIDGLVEGIGYETSSGESGITNSKGEYFYNEGDVVTFTVGSVELGSVPASALTSVLELDEPNKVALFLQLLDQDGNPNNGITVSPQDYIKLTGSDLLIEAVDSESDEFNRKLEILLPEIKVRMDEKKAKEHAIESFKIAFLNKYDKEVLDFIHGDFDVLTIGDFDAKDQLVDYQARLRWYIFVKYAYSFLTSEFNTLKTRLDDLDKTQEMVQYESLNVLDLVTDVYGLAGFAVSGFDAVEYVSKQGWNQTKQALYFSTVLGGPEALNKGSVFVVGNIFDGDDYSLLTRVIENCNLNLIFIESYPECFARLSGEIGIAISDLYKSTTELVTLRTLWAVRLARDFLALYYMYNGNLDVLNSIFEIIASEENVEYNYSTLRLDDDEQMEYILDILAKNATGMKYLWSAGTNYDYDDAKPLIKKYQKITEEISSYMHENFSEVIRSLDPDYIATSLLIEPIPPFYDQYKACLNMENVSSFDVEHMAGYVEFFLDEEYLESESFFIDKLSYLANPFEQRCTDAFSIQRNDRLLSYGVIRASYFFDYLPERSRSGSPEFIEQSGDKYFELSNKTTKVDFEKPYIVLEKNTIVHEGENIELDASASFSLVENDEFEYDWEILSSNEIPPSLSYDPQTGKADFIAYSIPIGAIRERIDLRVIVKSLITDEVSEKPFSVFVFPNQFSLEAQGAVDNDSLTLSTTGDSGWYVQTDTGFYDWDAVRSGDILDSQSSILSANVTGRDCLSFYWKVSSEADFDYLELWIDGELIDSISGEVDWAEKRFSLPPGASTVDWIYTKDNSVSSGQDAGWIDHVGNACTDAFWVTGTWSACSGPCGADNGAQSRNVVCVADGLTVSDALCPTPKPATEQSCTASQCVAFPAMPLNDTGITHCTNGWSVTLTCPVPGFPGQDAEHGRDITHDDDSDGHAGFNFTKLDAEGNPLPANAEEWSCVRDNVTGLIWEVKTGDGGLHDGDDHYEWYNPDAATNGGSAGSLSAHSLDCYGFEDGNPATYCNTQAYTTRVNNTEFCGGRDWRVPSVNELTSIVNHSGHIPIEQYFPWSSNTHWSASPYAMSGDYAWTVGFSNVSGGAVYTSRKYNAYRVLLVRPGP